MYKQTGNGRWVTHLGFERGNAIVEAQQRYVGRPWSGWSRMVIQQLPQMPPPSINYIDSSHYWVSRKRRTRSNSKSTCSWCCNKRRWSRWSTEIGQHILEGKILTGELKHNNIGFGRPWSGWTGTNVVERFVGVRFQVSAPRRHWVRISSGGNHATSWNHPGTSFNDRDRWQNYFERQPGFYNIWVSGDITEVHVEPGITVVYLDFYYPGRTTPIYVKVNGNIAQTWNPIQ